jgi:hypothetical protein
VILKLNGRQSEFLPAETFLEINFGLSLAEIAKWDGLHCSDEPEHENQRIAEL